MTDDVSGFPSQLLTVEALRRPVESTLAPAVAVMDQRGQTVAAAIVDRLLERIEDEVGAQRRRHAPADNPAREGVDDQRDVHKPAPRRDVREVGHPEFIRPGRREVPVDQIGGPRAIRLGVRRRDPGAAADHPGEPQGPHQPPHRTARHRDPVPTEKSVLVVPVDVTANHGYASRP